MAIDDDVARNRAAWDRYAETYQRLHASQLPTDAPTWGVWGLPEDLAELRPPEGARTTYREYASPEWARRWPAEQVWTVRRAP